MKTLDLNAYGVEEMSSLETTETNGGSFWGTLLVVAVVALVCAIAHELGGDVTITDSEGSSGTIPGKG